MALPGSDDQLMLLHNPRCSKSRATLALLEERSVPIEIRLYLEDPLSVEELEDLAGRIGRPVRAFTRQGQAEFADAGLGDASSDAEIRSAMAAAPILMERPILVRGNRAAIGRPPEDVLRLLD